MLTFPGAGDFEPDNYGGRNFHFGIREHSMAAIVNGMSLTKLRAYGETFFIFSDYARPAIRLSALMEVGPSVFFSLLVIAVAFLPVFTLVDQEGRLFRPLAFSKNFAMAIAAVLAVTLDPALRMLFARIEPFRFRPRALSWLASGPASCTSRSCATATTDRGATAPASTWRARRPPASP